MSKLEELIKGNEYLEVLKSAVIQINTARNLTFLQINATTNSIYWNLGKLLQDVAVLR